MKYVIQVQLRILREGRDRLVRARSDRERGL